MIENIQRRASKLAPSLKHLPYEDRLEKLGLTTLKREEKETTQFNILNHKRA